MKAKLFLFITLFCAFFYYEGIVYGQEYPPVEIKSVGMLQSGSANSLKYDLRIGLKNVNNKNVEISLIFLDGGNTEIFNWKGYILPKTDEIIVKKSIPFNIMESARYLNIRVSNADDQRNDYIANRFMIPKYADNSPL
ncbi:MAG: hypothetical protein LBH29_01565 [Elusimicrobiota bacterium]|jgi:hypothetical protein|nr:hypothetical protein [Elusimicrobiota bacterium]